MIGNKKGNTGENLACIYLEKNGYIIRDRNYRSAYGEIDIIAEKGDFMVFVEVKLRNKNSLVNALESVSLSKQKKIINTAMLYLQDNDTVLQPRFDVIAVVQYKDDEFSVEHIKSAFDTQDIYY